MVNPTQIALSLCISIALGPGSAVGQQLYRWVDKNGKVTYSQDPPPAGAAAKVEQKKLKGSVVDTGGLPYELQQTARNFPVTFYTGPDCADGCKNGRALLTKRGIPLKEVAVTDPNSLAELKKVSGKELLPVIVIGKTVLTGFQEDQWNAALDLVGYPKTAQTTPRPSTSAAKAASPPTSSNEKPLDASPAAAKP